MRLGGTHHLLNSQMYFDQVCRFFPEQELTLARDTHRSAHENEDFAMGTAQHYCSIGLGCADCVPDNDDIADVEDVEDVMYNNHQAEDSNCPHQGGHGNNAVRRNVAGALGDNSAVAHTFANFFQPCSTNFFQIHDYRRCHGDLVAAHQWGAGDYIFLRSA